MKFPNIPPVGTGVPLSAEDRKWVKLAKRLLAPARVAEPPEGKAPQSPRANVDAFEAPRATKKP